MKRFISLLLVLSFMIVLCNFEVPTVYASVADDGYDYIFLDHNSFTIENGWTMVESLAGGYSGKVLRSGNAGAETSAYVKSEATGEYDLWVRTVDYKSSPGTRTFSVRFNTGYLSLKAGSFDDVDWASQADGASLWQWECIGSVNMTKGVVNKVTLVADNIYSRFDCMLLTNNLSYTPLEKEQISTLEPYKQDVSSMTYNEELFGTTRYALTQGSLETLGTWTKSTATYVRHPEEHSYAFFGGYLIGRRDLDPSLAKDAVYRPYIHEKGTYSVWIRTGQDPSSVNPDADGLVLDINGVRSEDTYSFHTDKPNFAWEYAGEYEFESGINTIKLVDTKAYWARINCICITKDASCAPSNLEDEFKNSMSFVDLRAGTGDIAFEPDYISNSTLTPSSTVKISNDKVSVEFYNVTDGTHNFVQNKVTYDGHVLKDRDDMLARQLYRYGTASRSSYTDGSPVLNVTGISAMNTADGDWTSDSWGTPNEKIWTNVGTFNASNTTVSNVKGETVKVKLNIPTSGYYYGLTRGYTYNTTDTSRGYTVSVNGNLMKSDGSTHYFNVTNATTTQKYAFSFNKDPIYLDAGTAEIEMTSFGGYPMRTSFFTLIPADNTTKLQAEIYRLTDYDTAVSYLGGNALDDSYYGDLPITNTGYPHPITYDYVQKVNEPTLSVKTDNVFYMGIGEWLVPETATLTGENKVKLTYKNDYVDVTEIWELKEGDEEPRVTLTFTAKKRGGYYVVIPTHDEYEEHEYEYGLAPMQYRGHQFHKAPLLITEQYLFTPMVSVSLPEDNDVVPGQKVTYGYTVEPSWIDGRWVYNNDYDFGAVMRSSQYSENSVISPSLVASAPGGRNKELLVGESYTLKFRPIYRTGDWFENFTHVTEDLFGVRDYRENYYNSVTDAILNTTELMMDDFYSGWDDNSMSFWNMEGRAFTTHGAPLEIIQRYLLTDDDEILRKRAIPTIVSTMTRATHFKANTTAGGSLELYLGAPDTWPTSIGTTDTMFGASVFGGIYKMTQGSLEAAFERAASKANSIKDSSATGASVSDLVAMYKYTDDESYLTKAKTVADNYLVDLNNTINNTTPTSFNSFAYISFMPHISGLIDIYEVTGEQKYLDAAEYAGQVILTLVWNVGIDGDRANEQIVLDKDSVGARSFMANHNFWWMGDFKWRPGVDLDENMMPTEPAEDTSHPLRQNGFDEITSETVPAWLVSRVGIGLEQPSTFYTESLNIMMSNWAGDLMRLAEYLDDKQFEAAARNAIIGRFGTYPGYYINRFATLHMKENYHKESPVDITSDYWHHIPPFLSMIEDFLITQAWSWSDKNIEFPSTRQQGYAYFNNRQYGYEPGKFFNENNMWLWIDDDILSTDSVNLDWIAARKDGVMGIALMNEHSNEKTFEVQLGAKADADYTGKVFLYSPDGSIVATNAVNGKFSVTIPAKSLVGAVLASDEIYAPSFANSKYESLGDNYKSTVEHTDVTGAGTILQLSPESYFAHIYIEDKSDTASDIVVNYTVGDAENVHTVSDNVYPFEVIIELGEEDVKKPIHYTVQVKNADGSSSVTSKSYTMYPMNCIIDEDVEETGDATILLTGKNYSKALGFTTENAWDKTGYILGDYGLYKAGITSTPSVAVEVPFDGDYYIYGNIRTGHSTYPEKRYVSMSITQNGETIAVKDTDNSDFKFGYSLDVQEKNSDIIAGQYWTNGLGTMAPTPVTLKKGTAEIKISFGGYGGFDFLLLTTDPQVRAELNSCRVYEGKNIFKFWKDNTELKEMLMSYVDVEGPETAPVIKDTGSPYSSKTEIEISNSASDVFSYNVYVNNTLNSSVSASEVKENNGIIHISNIADGNTIYVKAVDGHGNESAASNVITSKNKPVRPASFTNLGSGTNYANVSAAESANVLPNGYFAMITQENMTKESAATKQDFNMLTGNTDNYYANATNFSEVFSGHFVIPETKDGESQYYQFISSYLRVWSSDAGLDDRRTHFILVDGKAVTEDGLVDWNEKVSYSASPILSYGTNSYVFGSENPTNTEYSTKHLWGYSPAVKLEPGVHTVEVYSRGFSGWFNNLIVTNDVGYDVTKLLYGKLDTRGTGWINNFTNVIKPSYTDYVAPVMSSGFTATAGETETTLNWAEATDTGYGATGKNIAYLTEIYDADNSLVLALNTTSNSASVPNLDLDTSYKAVITAFDGSGNKSNTVTETFTVSKTALSYVYGDTESQLVLNAAVNKGYAGDNVVYVVGYDIESGGIDSISLYNLTVPENGSATLKFDTPKEKAGVVYRLFVWRRISMKPLYTSIGLRTK